MAGRPRREIGALGLYDGSIERIRGYASPSFVAAFRRNFPNTPIGCEAVDDSMFFNRTFTGVLSWGLMFLLPIEEQRHLIRESQKYGAWRTAVVHVA